MSTVKTYQDSGRKSTRHISRRYTRAGNSIRNSIRTLLPNDTTEAVSMRSNPLGPFTVGTLRAGFDITSALAIWIGILARCTVHQSLYGSSLVGQQAAISILACSKQNKLEGQQEPSPQDLVLAGQLLCAKAHPFAIPRFRNG